MVMLDNTVLFDGTADVPPPAGGFAIASSWEQIPGQERVPYVELDDIRITAPDR